MKNKQSPITTILLIAVLLAGMSLLLYPTFSDYWNSLHQSHAISDYTEDVANLDKEEYRQIWDNAWNYNHILLSRNTGFALSDSLKSSYQELLNISTTGVMGYIEIPSINCSLPIYHGTDEAILQVAIGHLEWSSLPVGGESSHCVLSGHRGLPSAKLFTNLDKLQLGDIFMLRVLDEILTYEVDQILIVEPQDTDALAIVDGQDLCTLVTCTPYGINSHRLLVRGHRIENPQSAASIRVTADAMQIEPLIVTPIVATPMLMILLIGLLLPRRQRKSNGGIEIDIV